MHENKATSTTTAQLSLMLHTSHGYLLSGTAFQGRGVYYSCVHSMCCVALCCVVLWFSHLSLGAVGVRQWHGQSLTVPPAGAHPGEGVGASDERVAAPRGAQDTPGLWNVRVPCGRTNRRETETGTGSQCRWWRDSLVSKASSASQIQTSSN